MLLCLMRINISSFNCLSFVFPPRRWPRERPKYVGVYYINKLYEYTVKYFTVVDCVMEIGRFGNLLKCDI
jgi:hypothetical protein